MNDQRHLVLFEDFPNEMKISAIVDALYQMSGLKEQDRELSEIQGIFKVPSNAQNYVSYYVLFKYEDIFDKINEMCENINDERCIDIGGNLVRITLPGKKYARTIMEKPQGNQTILKVSNMVINLKRFAITLEKLTSMAETSSTKEIDSMMIVKTGEIVVTFACGIIASDVQQELNEKDYKCKEVAIHAIPREFEKISVGVDEIKEKPLAKPKFVHEVKPQKRKFSDKVPQQDLRMKMKKSQENRMELYHGPKPSTSTATSTKSSEGKGFNKVRITEDIKRFCALIASDEYEVFVRKKTNGANYEELFE